VSCGKGILKEEEKALKGEKIVANLQAPGVGTKRRRNPTWKKLPDNWKGQLEGKED
jgi:hypothetical protein